VIGSYLVGSVILWLFCLTFEHLDMVLSAERLFALVFGIDKMEHTTSVLLYYAHILDVCHRKLLSEVSKLKTTGLCAGETALLR